MDFNAAIDGDKAKDRVAVYRVAAVGQLIVHPLEVLANDENVIGGLRAVGWGCRSIENELLCRTHLSPRSLLALLQFHVFVDDCCDVERAFSQLPVELTGLLVAQLFDDTHHQRFFQVNLAVFELSFKHFFNQQCLLLLRFFDGQSDFGFGSRRLDDGQPFLLGPLG